MNDTTSSPIVLAVIAALLMLGGCAPSTWQERATSALSAVQGGAGDAADAVRAGELALLVKGDTPKARALLERALNDGGAPAAVRVRAALALVHWGRVTGGVAAIAHAVTVGLPLAQPQQAQALLDSCALVWGNLDVPGGAPEPLVSSIRAVAKGPGAGWEPVRVAAHRQLQTVGRIAKPLDAQRVAFEAGGVVTRWRLSAPWGDSPAYDARRTLGPEKRVLRPTESTGVGWARKARRTWSLTFSDGELTFPDMPRRGGVGYAEAWIEVPAAAADRRVVLYLESNRDASLWVQGTRVAELDRLVKRQAWQARAGVVLPPGTTRLLVKLSSDQPGGFARVRVSPLMGPTPINLAAAPGKSLSTASVKTFAPPTSSGAATGGPIAVGDGEAVVAAFAEFDALLVRPLRDIDTAYQQLARIAAAVPEYPGVALAQTRLYRADGDLGGAQSRGRRRTALERVLKTWPRNLPTLRKMAKLELADGRADEALAVLRKAVEVGQRDLGTRLLELVFYRQRGWEAEAIAAARGLESRGSHSPRVLQEVFDTYRKSGRATDASRALAALEKAYPQQAVVRRARLLGDREKLEERAALLLEHWARHPQRLSLAQRAVRALRAAGKPAAASVALGKVLQIRPEDPWALAEKVHLAMDRGDTAASRRAVDRALSLRPDLLQLEALKYWLLGQQPPLSDVADSQMLVDAYRKRASKPEAGGALADYPVVTLLDRTVVDVGPDGLTRELTHVVRVVQSKAGADKLGELRPPPDAQLLLVRTLKKDGRVLWPDRVRGKPDLSFSGLAPGDAVEWAWIRRSDVLPEEGGYMTGLGFAVWSIPTLRKEVDIAVSTKFRLELHAHNGAPTPKVSLVAGNNPDAARQLYRWAVDGLMAVPREPLAVSARLFFPYVDLTLWPAVKDRKAAKRAEAWRAVARNYSGRLSRLTQVGPRSRKGAEEMRVRAKRRGGMQAVWAAFDYVKEEINHAERLNQFRASAEQALAAQKGNRNVVLTAMAKALGVGADIVLCSPRPHGAAVDAAAPLPNANRFFYPVVRMNSGKKVTYADPSRPYNPFGVLPRSLYGSRCLDLTAASKDDSTLQTAFLTLPSYDLYEGTLIGWTFDIQVTVDATGSARGTLEGVGFGPVASGLRHVYLNADERRREQLWQQWTASVLKGARVVDWEVVDEIDADKPVAWRVEFTIANFLNKDGAGLAKQRLTTNTLAHYLGSVPTLSAMTRLPRRSTPLGLQPHFEEVRLQIDFPKKAGWKARTTLKDLNVDRDGFAAHQHITIKDHKLVVERDLTIGPGRIAAGEYDAFRKQVLSVIQGFSRGVTYGQ